MTSEDTLAIARLQVEVENLKQDITEIKTSSRDLTEAVREMRDAINMGRGGLQFVYKIGIALIALAGWAKTIYDMWPHR